MWHVVVIAPPRNDAIAGDVERYDARRHRDETLPRFVGVEHLPLGGDLLRISGGHALHPQVGVVGEEGAIRWA